MEWPYGRDDIEIYGTTGSIKTLDGRTMIFASMENQKKKLPPNLSSLLTVIL